MSACGARHPDHPGVECIERAASHPEHIGHFEGRAIEWENEDFVPPVQKKPPKDARAKAIEKIAAVVGQSGHPGVRAGLEAQERVGELSS